VQLFLPWKAISITYSECMFVGSVTKVWGLTCN